MTHNTLQDEVMQYLIAEPKGRERQNKARFIANLLIKRNGLTMDRELLMKVVIEAESINRYWRKTLEDYPTLRGKDYADGKPLAQEKQISLGYEIGYHRDIK